MLLANIREDVAGRFGQDGEWVKVGSYIAPDPRLVPELIEAMFVEYHGASSESIIRKVALLHLTFECPAHTSRTSRSRGLSVKY
jgi:hypothetical protein